jgi:hypothetical protein
MKINNFWTNKKNEKLMVKIVQLAQRNGKKVEHLTKEEMTIALKEEK